MSDSISIHPLVDNGVTAGSKDFAGGTLTCHCVERPVKVVICPGDELLPGAVRSPVMCAWGTALWAKLPGRTSRA